MLVYEVRPRKDRRGVDLISDALAFGRLWTLPPCPLRQGYWKNNPDAWPVTSLILGSQTYSQAEIADDPQHSGGQRT